MRTGFSGLVLLSALCGLVGAGNAQAPGGSNGSCTVNRLRLRVSTGDDDLRGGQDNLNIIVFFTNAKPHVALNVNKSANWPNNSVNNVDIVLNPSVPAGEIKALRFVHIADGGINTGDLLTALTPAAPIKVPQAFQSPDNWNMAEVTVSALGNGVGARIAAYGYHRFTGSDPVLTIPVQIPVDVCSSGRSTGNTGSPSNSGSGSGGPGTAGGSSGLQSIPGNSGPGGSAPGALTNQDVVRMAKAEIPESAIIASIQTRPAKFDLSPEGLIALKRAGVSQSVLQAMVSHKTAELVPAVRPNNGDKVTDELNPQPYPPKSRTDASASAKADELNPQPYPPKAALLNPGGQKPMLERQANAPLGNSSESPLIPAGQQPAIKDGGKQAATAPSSTGHPSGGDQGPKEVSGKAEYEPITADRGVTNDPQFNQWANKTNQTNKNVPPQTPAPTATTPTAIAGGSLSLSNGTNPGNSKSAAPPPQTATGAGPTVIAGGTLSLNSGTNTGNSKSAAPPPQTATAAGPTVIGAGTLNLNGGTNPVPSQIVQTPQTIPAATPSSEPRGATSEPRAATAGGGKQLGAQVTAPHAQLALNTASVQAACAQDPTPRILGVTPSSGPIIFGPGRQYVVWGCSFGPANPGNAVYLSNGSSFTWYLQSSSWSSNAIAVSFSLASSGAQDFQKTYGTQLNNLVLFVLGQNGNSKLNGVALSAQ